LEDGGLPVAITSGRFSFDIDKRLAGWENIASNKVSSRLQYHMQVDIL
jgi:hypothetical protein